MGVFGGYYGPGKFPVWKCTEIRDNALKLLQEGGMMQIDAVTMYGKEVAMIHPVELDESGEVYFHYNYFEDRGWETACFHADTENVWLATEKIGSSEFNRTCMAVQALFELYDGGIGWPVIDGDVENFWPYAGWINHVCGTSFGMEKRCSRVWDYYERRMADIRRSGSGRDYSAEDFLKEFFPKNLWLAAAGVELADVFYVSGGTSCLDGVELDGKGYPAAVRACREVVKVFLDSVDGAWEKLRGLLEMERATRQALAENGKTPAAFRNIADCSLRIPAHMLYFLACEYAETDFWESWSEIGGSAYCDENRLEYTPEWLARERKEEAGKPVEPVWTSKFLRMEDSIHFWGESPDEPRQVLEEDDLAYWWDGTDKVQFSDEMVEWLAGLSESHKAFMEKIQERDTEYDSFLKDMLDTFTDLDDSYKHIFPFSSMFYDFLAEYRNPACRAALEVVKKVGRDNMEYAGMIGDKVYDWDLISRNKTYNIGRRRMKRILVVMANRKLRKMYFGF